MDTVKLLLVLIAATLTLVFSGACHCWAAQSKVDVLLNKADAYSKQGNLAMAAKLYGQAIKMQPGDLGLYHRRAFMWGKQGYYTQAIKDFSYVIGRDEMNARLHFPSARKHRADCFLGMGYLQKAIDDYTILLRKFPKSDKVWLYLAEAYALAGRKDLAMQATYKGLAAGGHREKKLRALQMKILSGEKITPHRPLSN